MTEGKVIRLPDLDVMRQQLLEINRHPHLQKCFYYWIINHHGMEMSVPEFTQMLHRAVLNYQNSSRGGVSNYVWYFPVLKIDVFVDAFVKEESVAFEIKETMGDLFMI